MGLLIFCSNWCSSKARFYRSEAVSGALDSASASTMPVNSSLCVSTVPRRFTGETEILCASQTVKAHARTRSRSHSVQRNTMRSTLTHLMLISSPMPVANTVQPLQITVRWSCRLRRRDSGVPLQLPPTVKGKHLPIGWCRSHVQAKADLSCASALLNPWLALM